MITLYLAQLYVMRRWHCIQWVSKGRQWLDSWYLVFIGGTELVHGNAGWYLLVLGQHGVVLVNSWWYVVSTWPLCLDILKKKSLDLLTDSQTLIGRASHLLRSRRGALITQLVVRGGWGILDKKEWQLHSVVFFSSQSAIGKSVLYPDNQGQRSPLMKFWCFFSRDIETNPKFVSKTVMVYFGPTISFRSTRKGPVINAYKPFYNLHLVTETC